MSSIRFRVTDKDFHHFRGVRVQQGEVHVGPEIQGTILRSCLCIGFYSPARRIGAITHITGFGRGDGHHAPRALDMVRKGLSKRGMDFSDCECFVIGGATEARHVYEAVVSELKQRAIAFEELDTLGRSHRKLLLDPSTGELTLYKKAESEFGQGATGDVHPEHAYQCFNDPKKRVVTGASVLFRNRQLLKCLQEEVLPNVLGDGNRLHVWCAGCSTGMEVYSIAMVGLAWLEEQGKTADFRVLGSDISREALDFASAGEYPVTAQTAKGHGHLLERYTEQIERHVIRMGPELPRVVAFKSRDLRVGSRRHRFELVVCDHVFQYFQPDVQREFLTGLVGAVQHRGYLYLSTPTVAVRDSVAAKHPFTCIARNVYRRK
ncbi:MAG: hypothetical protein GY851_12380 [bacterium]|nr:hypothetical protein [bacterium]